MQNFEQMKRNYDIEVTSKKYRNELKDLYKNKTEVPDNKLFQESQIDNNSYEFKENVNDILNCFKVNFPLEFDKLITTLQSKKEEIDNIYENSDNICNWINYQQQQFFTTIKNKAQEMETFEMYLNSLLNKLPDWDPKNTKIREKIQLLINNNCKPIIQKLIEYQKLQNDADLSKNLKNIDKYIGKIKNEINIIKDKITGKTSYNTNNITEENDDKVDLNYTKNNKKLSKKKVKEAEKEKKPIDTYTLKNKTIFDDLNNLKEQYNNLLYEDEFFKTLQDEIKYDNGVSEFIKNYNK